MKIESKLGVVEVRKGSNVAPLPRSLCGEDGGEETTQSEKLEHSGLRTLGR